MLKIFKSKRAKTILANKYVRNIIIMFCVILVFLLIDMLMKKFLFDSDFDYEAAKNDSNVVITGNGINQDFVVIGVRSVFHKSTTFLDFIGKGIPSWGILVINFTIATIFLIAGFFSKTKMITIGLSVTLAGIFGNTIDNLFLGGVRDILYIPWFDRGTFNLADVLVVVGSVWAALSFIFYIFKNDSKKVKKTK